MHVGNYDVSVCGWEARYAGNGCHTVAHGHTRGNYIAGMFSGTPGGHNEQSGSFKGERDLKSTTIFYFVCLDHEMCVPDVAQSIVIMSSGLA